MSSTKIALTMGDPAGIGPEIIVKACKALAPRIASGEIRLLIIGSLTAFRDAEKLVGYPTGATLLNEPPDQLEHKLAMLNVSHSAAAPANGEFALGQVSAAAGWYAYQAVACAVDLAMAGIIDAIVTAPLNKEALNLAGYAYAGHTDMLADMTGAKDSVMMLAHDNIRVSHVSTHVAIEDVTKLVTAERVSRVVELTHQALGVLGVDNPRIAIAALNPHAGEGGIFGRKDIDVIEPLVSDLRDGGLQVFGPIPGDTVFVKLRGNQYDAVVAMYHDQGHIPVKLLGFQKDPKTGDWLTLDGVNITLGLPIVRTSVDHGTAFDIAGKGIAMEGSLIEAVDYAIKLSKLNQQAKVT